MTTNAVSPNTNAFCLTTQEQLAYKKMLYGFDAATTLQKIAFAFFADNAQKELPCFRREMIALSSCPLVTKGPSTEGEELFKTLRRFQWSAGSLTTKQFGEELLRFLCSDEATFLNESTREELKAIALIFQETAIQDEIDLARSEDMGLVFMAKLGTPFFLEVKAKCHSLINPQSTYTCDAINVDLLTQMTVDKIDGLKVGERAVFLTGSLVHETLIYVERKEDNSYELCYYNSNSRDINALLFDKQAVCDVDFWNCIYECKQQPDSSIDKVFTVIERQRCDNRAKIVDASCAVSSTQKTNTCHFKCLLACLKDRIVRSSSPDTAQNLLEWRQFKKQFGAFLLSQGTLQDPTLISFARAKQEWRERKGEMSEFFATSIQERRESSAVYKKLLKCFVGRPLKRDDLMMPKVASPSSLTKTLEKFHRELLRTLEDQLVTPDELRDTFAKIDDACVQGTFKLFCKRFDQRQKLFERALDQELQSLSPASVYLGQIKESLREAAHRNPFAYKFQGMHQVLDDTIFSEEYKALDYTAPIAKEKLLAHLDRFEANPQMLQQIVSKPACRTLFFQAIQIGEVDRVVSILKQLSKNDQVNFCYCCSVFSFNLATNGGAIERYMRAHRDPRTMRPQGNLAEAFNLSRRGGSGLDDISISLSNEL